MTPPRERLPWEYARGPEVGSDVPITSEPRDEEVPGVPVPPAEDSGRDGAAGGNGNGRGGGGERDGQATATEEREVRAADPALSPETNARLTEELRDVVGAEKVRVPADRPRATRGERPPLRGAAAFLAMHRFQLIRTTAIMLTFGAIVSLITGHWWLLALAAGVHALGTMTVLVTTVGMTTIIEHPSPEVSAAMTEEGVHSPDERFSEMVEEFQSQPERGTGEVLSPGYNERSEPAGADTPAAAEEQRSAMTPTAEPSEPGGEGRAPDIMIWTTAASLFVLSIVLPATMGGRWMWLLPAVMVPLLAAWVLMQGLMVARPDQVHVQTRGRLIAIVLSTTVAVAIFCGVVAIAFAR